MHRKRHADERPEVQPDPVVARAWREGLSHRAAGAPVIRAPHAADLVAPAAVHQADAA